MSPLLRYYSGLSSDDHGRTLAATQALDHQKMEYYHDFIQWLSPLREPSHYNPTAPTLTDADILAFHTQPALRDNLRLSFVSFLSFLGLSCTTDGRVVPLDSLRPKLFSIPNHNWLRITRVLLCLKTLGLDAECQAFFEALRGFYESGVGITEETFDYWKDASKGVAR